ncbi:hypothetical protein MRX96_049930 [Rhipicephalus microplus]
MGPRFLFGVPVGPARPVPRTVSGGEFDWGGTSVKRFPGGAAPGLAPADAVFAPPRLTRFRAAPADAVFAPPRLTRFRAAPADAVRT